MVPSFVSVEKYPDRFPGFIASMPMNNPEAAVKEIDRAIKDLYLDEFPKLKIIPHHLGVRQCERTSQHLIRKRIFLIGK